MNNLIGGIKSTRQYLVNQLRDLAVTQLNKIPEGFNNNIIWNLGHMIAAQQGICYVRAGAKTAIDEKYYVEYKPGTKPEQFVDESEIETIKSLLLTSLDLLEKDYDTDKFVYYPTWSTRYGVEIASIDDAIQFLLYQEGVHAGTISALIKLVKAESGVGA